MSLSPSSIPIVNVCVPDKANAKNGSPSVAVLFIISPVVPPAPPKANDVSAVWVKVISSSAPKLSNAPSDCKLKSSAKITSSPVRVSIVLVPIALVPILNLSLSPSSIPIVNVCVPLNAKAKNGSPSPAVLSMISPVVPPAPASAILASAA